MIISPTWQAHRQTRLGVPNKPNLLLHRLTLTTTSCVIQIWRGINQ